MLSILAGVLLGLAYSFFVHRWVFRTSKNLPGVSRPFFMVSALFRLVLIVSVFFLLLNVAILDLSIVLICFLMVITLFLLNIVRKAYETAVKVSGLQSQGRV